MDVKERWRIPAAEVPWSVSVARDGSAVAFGSWDKNRSITHPSVFLFAFQDLSYDLTTVPPPPGEPWQGLINGIRVDPVVRFLDVLNQPADGWFEIERVAIY